MTVIAKKYHIIERITDVEDVDTLNQIEQILNNNSDTKVDLSRYIKPMKKKLDVEAAKKEQNYQGVSKEEMEQLIKAINITESLDELIASI